jgi:hypothetical protein
MPVTRSSGSTETDDFVMQMDNYMKSSEVFRSVIVEALNFAISETLKPLQADIKFLKSENEALRSELAEVKAKSNENEQYSRRNNVRIFGLPENVRENCYDVVLDLCNELNIEVSRNELDRVHRVGRVSNVADYRRPMIVKLIGHQSKLKLIKARKNLKGKDIYIREDLTKVNHALLMFVKKNCMEKTIVYTVDGVIMARLPGSGQIYRIKTKDDMVTYGLVNKTSAADF